MYKWEFYKRHRYGFHPRQVPEHDEALTGKSIREIFSGCSDLTVRELFIGGRPHGRATAFYLDGLVDSGNVAKDVIRPLSTDDRLSDTKSTAEIIDCMIHGAVWAASMKHRDNTDDAVSDILNGFCVIVFDREKTALSFENRTPVARSIGEPSNEKTVKGARDAFVETLRINTSLVRRHLRSPQLKFVSSLVGRKSHTGVAIAYVQGIAPPEIVEQVKKRLDSMDVDGLLTAGYLEEYLSDAPRTPFPTLMHTERPDRFALNLLEGRVGIIIDGLPIAWLVPGTMAQMMKVPQDKADHFLVASGLTLLRYLALVLSVLLPAAYVAIAMYHHEMIPTKLLLSIIESKQQVPFSTAMEILGMLVAFELLQQAGLRLPKPVGETIGIVGALIVGQSAVEAKVVSPIAVIVVALAGIAGYTIPNQDLSAAFRLCRFALVFAALLAGMFGVMLGLSLLVYHLCTLESFGLPYMSPLGTRGLLGSVFRVPLRKDKFRDPELHTPDKRNQK